jgi:hypothetical protein
MNPLHSHWVRVSMLLLLATPVVALAVTASTDADVRFTALITLYMWALVCGILAVVALGGLAVRLLGRGLRALRR